METEGIHVIAYEDDAFQEDPFNWWIHNATTDNALNVLKIAENEVMEVNGSIEAINTDRGSQFYPNKKDKNGEADSVFRDYLQSKRIIHIPSRRNNPQTNGKIERWFQEYLRHRHKFNSANEFRIGIMIEYTVLWNLNGVKPQMKLLLEKMQPESILGRYF